MKAVLFTLLIPLKGEPISHRFEEFPSLKACQQARTFVMSYAAQHQLSYKVKTKCTVVNII